MSRISKPSLTDSLVRRATGDALPAQKTAAAPPRPASSKAAASGFDTRRTFSKLSGVGSKRSRGNSHASLGRVDDQGADDESLGRNRGTPDDSIGRNRGTADDSIGRNRGTADDSIGRNRGTADDSIGGSAASGGKGRKKKAKQKLSGEVFEALLMGGGKNKGAGLLGGMNKKGARQGDDALLFAMLGGQPQARDAGGGNRNKTSRGGADPTNMFSLMGGLGMVPTGTKSPRTVTRTRAPTSSTPTQDVLNSRSFQALPAAERETVRSIMSKGGPNAAAGMAELFNSRKVGLLHEVDADGVTVLQHLEAMASSAHPRVVGDVLSDIATPKDIEQGYAPTCTTTSMQYELAKERPAEYARLMAGLVVDGKVTMEGGGVLEVDVTATIAQSDRTNDQRTDSEAIFQTAAMEFANGADHFSIDRQRSEGASKVYRGLFPEQIRTMVGQLFGERYLTREITSDEEAADELKKLASREGPNRPVLFDLNMGSFNHLVSLEEVTQNAVKYRDPSTGEVHSISRFAFIRSLVAVHYAESMGG